MNRLGRVLLLTASLVVTTAVVGHFHPGKIRAAGIDQVQVVNSTASPVPVTGSVTAAQSGPWTVGINGTPTVNVATAPPVNVNFPSSISVTNPLANPSQPVPLVVAGNSASFVTLFFNGSYQQVRPDGSTTNFTFPANQSLVITDVSWEALCNVGSGCSRSIGDQVTFFLGSFYIATDTYKSAAPDLVAGHTDHLTTGIVLTQLPTPGFLFAAQPGEIINAAIFQGYLAPMH